MIDPSILRERYEATAELITEQLRGRVEAYHAGGVRALLRFFDDVGEMLEEDSPPERSRNDNR